VNLENLSCRRRVALLLDYLDRTLPADESKHLSGHRKSCRTCSALLASLERTVKTLHALKRGSKAPASVRRSLRAALARSPRA
jgi:anti-sigma factor RsiW